MVIEGGSAVIAVATKLRSDPEGFLDELELPHGVARSQPTYLPLRIMFIAS